jgi:hypothetical protein
VVSFDSVILLTLLQEHSFALVLGHFDSVNSMARIQIFIR